MKEIRYILIPAWRFKVDDAHECDIPPYFVKSFSTKKEIEDYLNSNDIERELTFIKDDSLMENAKRSGNNNPTEVMRKMLSYDLTFWVIGVNPVGKENRIGIVQQEYNDKEKHLKWKYRSYFGGKLWKDSLLFGIYR